jgi:hypothetical protein
MNNIFTSKVSSLPKQGHYYISDISYFDSLKFLHHYPYCIVDDSIANKKHNYKTLLITENYRHCLIKRDFTTNEYEIKCSSSYEEKPGMQLILCSTQNSIILQPSWICDDSKEINLVTSYDISKIRELAGLCSNQTIDVEVDA